MARLLARQIVSLAGLFLPTQGAALIPWVDSVLADIGDSQSLAENLSTFSGHMANIKKISEIATPQSLVLLDELGAGTDPTEGAALGMSLLRYFSGVAGLTLATTHHSELKTLKINDPRFENAGVEFNEASLQPTYKVFVGIPGRSNALNISEKLGLDARVLASARAIYGTVEAQVDDLIAELEDAKKLNNEYLAQEAALQRQARSLRAKLAVLTSAESAQREEMMRKQRDAINVAIQEGRSKVTEIVREVQARGSQATAGSSLNVGRGQGAGVSGGRLVQGLPQPAGPAETTRGLGSRASLTVGEEVYVPRLSAQAKVVRLADDGKTLLVQMGAMQLRVTMDEIVRRLGEEEQSAMSRSPSKNKGKKGEVIDGRIPDYLLPRKKKNK